MSQLKFGDCPTPKFKLPRQDVIQFDTFSLSQPVHSMRREEGPFTKRKVAYGGGPPALHSGRIDTRTGLPAKDHNVTYIELPTQDGSVKVPVQRQVSIYEPSSATIEGLHSLTGSRLPPTKESFL